MKIRVGFVSNSSSSSFVCSICGEEVSGYDMSLEDAGMKQCVNNHCWCDSHDEDEKGETTAQDRKQIIMKKEAFSYLDEDDQEEFKKMTDDDEIIDFIESHDLAEDERYELPEEDCPICQFKILETQDIATYLMKTVKKESELRAELKSKFKTYAKFLNFIGKKKD